MSYVDIGRKYGVDSSTARNWVTYEIKEDGRKNNGKKVTCQSIEEDLLKLLVEKREKGIPINKMLIMKEIRKLFCQHLR